MNFRRAGRRRAKGMVIMRLPLVAFIDVVLFLLLYFVTAADITPEESHLPSAIRTDAKGRATGASLLPQIVRVEAVPGGGVRYRLGDRVASDKAALGAVLAQLPKDAGVVVKVDGSVPVWAAAAALSAARDAGFVKISYVAGK